MSTRPIKCKSCTGQIKEHDFYPTYQVSRDEDIYVSIEATCPECGAEYVTEVMQSRFERV